MKKHFLTQLLILCVWLGADTAQAAIPGAVLGWGAGEDNGSGPTTVPVTAQSGVTAVAAGVFHNVALKTDGNVVAWRDNSYGQTAVPAGLTGVMAIAAGASHTVALKNDGSVVAWGRNKHGQTNVPATAQSGVTAIAAGTFHTVALKNDGSVVVWGDNGYGLTNVPIAAYSGVTAISAGYGHILALKNDGSVVAWGYNEYGETTVPLAAQSGVTAISAGGLYTMVLKNDGRVLAWGYNGYNQTNVPAAAQSGVTAIAAGGSHAVALKSDGSVVAWGYNAYGQTTVPVAAQTGVTAIAAGAFHTVVLVTPTPPTITMQPGSQTVNEWQSASLTVLVTGYPLNYQWRKDGVDLPGATSAIYSVTFVQTNQAGDYTVVVSNSAASVTSVPPAVLTVNAAAHGTVVAWGADFHSCGTPLWLTAVPLAAQSGVTAIAIAAEGDVGGCQEYSVGHSVALKSDGSIVEWRGGNEVAETTTTLAAQSGVTAIAAGGGYYMGHTVVLKNDGSVVVWGDNLSGQTNVPTGLSGVRAIAAGSSHTVALTSDGSVVAWGNNYQGQVTGTPTHSYPYSTTASPVTLAGQVLSGVTAVSAGEAHTVALKNDGTVVAWGDNYQGQVTGTPTTDLPNSATANPVTLTGQILTGVTAIAAGGSHTVALKNDGTVVAWGADFSGQTTVPTGLSGVTAIAAGWYHTVALKTDGSVVAWGNNYSGETTVPVGLSGVTAIAAGYGHTVALIGGVPLLPYLSARPGGNELILSWSTNAVGFTLQSTLSLTPPVTWVGVTNPPAVLGAQWTITNAFSSSAQFYRLQKP